MTKENLPAVADDAMRAAILRGTPDAKLGPAMRALNERQRLFVTYMVECPGNATRAATFAGYSTASPEGLRVTAHRLSHDDKILAALHEESSRRMKASAIIATTRLVEIAGDPTHKDQIKAIGMVLDRAGLHAHTEHTVKVEHSSDQDAVKRIVALCQEMNIDPRMMLGKVDGLVIDADYQIVSQDQQSVGSTAGLEDLL